jgi:hypothetical protein
MNWPMILTVMNQGIKLANANKSKNYARSLPANNSVII